MNWNTRLSSLVLALLAFSDAAKAQTLPNYTTWAFSGVVRHYVNVNGANVPVTVPPQDLAAVGVLPGTLLTGTITLDLDAPDGAPQAGRGLFGPVVGAKMTVGNFNLNLNFNPSGPINLTIIDKLPGLDDFLSSAFAMRGQSIDVILGYLELNDRTRTAFVGADQLPAILPPLSAFDAYNPNARSQTRVGFSVNANSSIWLVNAELTQLQQIPEPSTLFLFAVGAISLIGRRRVELGGSECQ